MTYIKVAITCIAVFLAIIALDTATHYLSSHVSSGDAESVSVEGKPEKELEAEPPTEQKIILQVLSSDEVKKLARSTYDYVRKSGYYKKILLANAEVETIWYVWADDLYKRQILHIYEYQGLSFQEYKHVYDLASYGYHTDLDDFIDAIFFQKKLLIRRYNDYYANGMLFLKNGVYTDIIRIQSKNNNDIIREQSGIQDGKTDTELAELNRQTRIRYGTTLKLINEAIEQHKIFREQEQTQYAIP